ncbi:MAG: hypothetical protein HQL34_05520 [Alphaproteobacteria bacterium]|nr:hypothetical protein [Alphaproteobacteria bacterium]
MALADLQALVDGMMRADAATVSSEDRDAAIGVAVLRYSKDRPRTVVEDIAAAGGPFLDLPSSWEAGSSTLVELEHPVDSDPKSRIAATDAQVEVVPNGSRIRLTSSISAGETVRTRFTGSHIVSGTEDTLPSADREAVATYAAAHLLDALAAARSSDTDASIGAAAVSRATPAQEYAARAKDLRRRYTVLLGIDPSRIAPAGAVVVLPGSDSLGRDRLLHPRRLS